MLQKQLISELEAYMEMKAVELSRIKGFSFTSVKRAVTIIIAGAFEFVPSWAGATPEDRNDAVVDVLHRHWKVPAWIVDIAYHVVTIIIGQI